jgi:hypothetical protein
MARNNTTIISGYNAPASTKPSREANNGMDLLAWLDKHLVTTHRRGKWSNEACQKIAHQKGIIENLEISVK